MHGNKKLSEKTQWQSFKPASCMHLILRNPKAEALVAVVLVTR